MEGQASGEAAMRRAYRRVWLTSLGANFAVASTFFIGLVAWNYALFPEMPWVRPLVLFAGFGAVSFSSAAVYAYVVCRAVVLAAMKWLTDSRPATPDEQRAVALIPRRVSIASFAYWLVLVPFGMWFMTSNIGYEITPFVVTKALLAWLMLAFAASMLTYLFVERVVRGERAEALAGAALPAGPGAMSMTARLLLAWLGAAFLPLSTISLFFIGATAAERARGSWVVWMITGVGLIAGFLVTLFAARTIVEPVLRVRGAMRGVAEGDLTAELDVDDASELGLLQSGFNQMVAGLRERERVRELFGRHVGADVAKHALESDLGLGGELCEATTMFVDMVGSTGMTLRRSPDEVVASLNTFFDAVVAVVAFEGGSVNQFQGDGAVCVFGVPDSPPDHAARALRAARTLHRTLEERNIAAGIGISSGEMVAGNVGTAARYGFTVIGDPVNEAARLTDEAKATPERVLASENAVASAGDEGVNWVEHGSLTLRGRERPTVAYRPR